MAVIDVLKQKQARVSPYREGLTSPGNLTTVCDVCGDVGRIAQCTGCPLKICLTTTDEYLGCVLMETLNDGDFICPVCYFNRKEATPVSATLS